MTRPEEKKKPSGETWDKRAWRFYVGKRVGKTSSKSKGLWGSPLVEIPKELGEGCPNDFKKKKRTSTEKVRPNGLGRGKRGIAHKEPGSRSTSWGIRLPWKEGGVGGPSEPLGGKKLNLYHFSLRV